MSTNPCAPASKTPAFAKTSNCLGVSSRAFCASINPLDRIFKKSFEFLLELSKESLQTLITDNIVPSRGFVSASYE